MAFGVSVTKTVTQVLFFKLRESDIQLRHSSGKVTINTDVLDAIRDDVKKKISKHSKSFVVGLPDLN